jgi:hypothetical protein
MHRRMAIIPERDVAKFELRGHASPQREPDGGPQAGDDEASGAKA